MKLLVVAPEAVDAAAVRRALPDEDLGGAEVFVVSPALQESGVRFWMSDSDGAIAHAEQAKASTVAELRSDGETAVVRGATGESEPLQAVHDALATFPADRVLLFRRADEHAYREEELEAARERIGVPVTEARL